MDSADLISLNVGGTIFTTTLATLTKDPDSMLAAMFRSSDLPPAKKDSNGCYFIDRSPRPFEVILDFLRTGHLNNLNGCTLRQLEVEADFFGLSGLQEIIRQRLQEDNITDWMTELEGVKNSITRVFRLAQFSLHEPEGHVKLMNSYRWCEKGNPVADAFLEATRKLQERKLEIMNNTPH